MCAIGPLAFVTTESLLRACSAGAQEQPEDEADYRQQHDDDDPQHLAARRSAALYDVDDRPDVGDKDQQPENSAYFDAHGEYSLRYMTPVETIRAIEPVFGSRSPP